MGLIRKHSLDQLLDIQKQINKIGDIGRVSTDKVEDHYDYDTDTDTPDSDAIFDMSNVIQKGGNKNKDTEKFVKFLGQGNLGEYLGDLTDQEFANNWFQHNPLCAKKELDTYEEFDHQYNFANSWTINTTPKKKLHKVEENNKYNEKNKKSYFIKKFIDFDKNE